MQLILVGTGAATIWIMPFMDYWDNVISISSMGGTPLQTYSVHHGRYHDQSKACKSKTCLQALATLRWHLSGSRLPSA